MSKLFDFLDLFRKGAAVSDPKLWKNRSAFTLALLLSSGCSVPTQPPTRLDCCQLKCSPTASLHWTPSSPLQLSGDPLNPTTPSAEIDGGALGVRCRF